MLKQKWIIGLVVFDGVAIIILAIFLFANFSTIDTRKGIILLIFAAFIMLLVIGTLIYLARSIAPKNKQDKNTPHKS
jgi:hypothetical protein